MAAKMASIGDQFLPEDMLIEILLRLPVKSLLRFKCVCKNWYSLIQSHKFITNHYNHPNNQTRLLVIQTPRYSSSYFILFSDETLSNAMPEEAVRNQPTSFDDRLYNIFGPVNGLFLMDFFDHWTFPGRLALWNPTTGELSNLTLPAIKRPPPNGGFWNNWNNGFRLGFGLDLLTNDHKVVWIQFLKDFEIPFRPRRGVVSLYNVTNDSWKEIDTDLADGICSSKLTTYMNGAYYWLSCNGPTMVMVLFDMSKEVFRDVEPPPCFNQNSKYTQYELMCCGDESIPLLVVIGWMRSSIDMWVMKGEGCWTKDFTVGLSPELYFPRVLCYPRGFLQNGRLLYHQDEHHLRQLFSYNIHDREIKNLELRGHFLVVNYKESLASIKGGRKQRKTSPVTTA